MSRGWNNAPQAGWVNPQQGLGTQQQGWAAQQQSEMIDLVGSNDWTYDLFEFCNPCGTCMKQTFNKGDSFRIAI